MFKGSAPSFLRMLAQLGNHIADQRRITQYLAPIANRWCGTVAKGTEVNSRKTVVQGSILLAAAISMALSVWLWFSGSKEQGLFVAIWVPSILSFGALMLSGSKGDE